MIEFKAWGKTPRLNRDITVTEKIDGTNAAIIVARVADSIEGEDVFCNAEGTFRIGAQSRNRLITPGKTTDNYGFAGWVRDNAFDLLSELGEGHHYGEWWGKGIAIGYGVEDKRFSLFNTHRYAGIYGRTNGLLDHVPVLYQGPFSQAAISTQVERLRELGSVAAPGFDKPEGVIVYHSASRQVYKVLLENDEIPKGLVAA